VDALFFKFSLLLWTVLGANSQSTFFAVSYSGRLDRVLERIKLNSTCWTFSRRIGVICASIAWAMILVNALLALYSVFFTKGDMDITLAPVTIHVNLSDLLIPRIVMYLFSFHHTASWIFPHAMSFLLATILTRQYRTLGRSFDRMLAESDERRLSDSDIETLEEAFDV